MAVRTILHYPDKRLREQAQTVTRFDAELAQLLEDMAETMYAAPGVGLAAPQIGVALKIFVIDVATDESQPSEFRVFINPEILESAGEVCNEEGCLSFPGVHEEVVRAERVRVRAQNAKGEHFELEADGILAIAVQHENDHLNGKLMVDHLGMLRRRMVHRTMVKRAATVSANA
jgi:peptide deformylase